ncbi:ABC transporter permease [Acuticoccus sp. MNP-M23]|uniref:ABC transporter permease n=1 Tax=Acuticoccus sp. MNP-M23 TaxID=3072793 RepID=UPI0028159561|nr:ABC transporter permease [Acuticoccus sp. MNP-M23]WMS41890.1 ABC transporter permease [Acuticoccus sp. MNP-M23]
MIELFLSQILNGLVIGFVYALIALGFSLVFGVANIINFAQGALLMLGAYITFTLVRVGAPILVGIPVAIAVTTIAAMLIERLALRPLQNAPYIAPLLSTLAIAIIFDSAAELIWSSEIQSFPSPLSRYVVFIGSAYLTGVDLAIMVVSLTVMAGLTLFLSRTWLGNAMRATAQDPEAAAQMGIDVPKIRQISFGLAGALGAIAGVLIGMYYLSVFPQMGIPFGLKGFSAALLGGLSSIPGAIVGGLLLGVFESLASGYVGEGYRDIIAFSILLLVISFRPHGLFGKKSLDALGGATGASGGIPTTSIVASMAGSTGRTKWRLFEAPLPVLLAVLALFAFLPLVTGSNYILQVGVQAAVYAVLAVSLTLLTGAAGVVSIGHAAFFGVGAYVAALSTVNLGIDAELAILFAGVGGAVFAAVLYAPTIRLSGHTVALATLAIGQIVYLLFLNWIDVTRGPMGIPGVPRPDLGLIGISMRSLTAQYWQALVLLGIAVTIAAVCLNSPIGRIWRAIREDRLAAHASGIPVPRYLILAFVVSGFLAGLAGAQFAFLQNFVSPDSFTIDTSIIIISMIVLGGLGNVTGALIGGVLLALLPEVLREFAEYRMIAYGAVLLLLLRFRPQGLAGTR